MMLADVSVSAESASELARIIRAAGADELADRLERALADQVKLLALTIDERDHPGRPQRAAGRARRLDADP